MFDRARFWSAVPEWPQALLEREGLRITVREHAALWLVSGDTVAFLARHGLECALGPRDTTDSARLALRLAPDRLLFVSGQEIEGEFGWTPEGCAISELGDGLICIELAGPGAQEMLQRASEYPFASAASQPQESAQMMLAGVRVIVARRASGWWLFVERPWASALWRWLEKNLE